MNFLSWNVSCVNSLGIFTNFFSNVAGIVFVLVLSFVSANIVLKNVFINKKDKSNTLYLIGLFIIFLLLSYFVVVPAFEILADVISEKLYVVDSNYEEFIYENFNYDKALSIDEIIEFNKHYVLLWMYGISIISCLYFYIVNKIKSLKNIKKFIKYLVYVLIIIVLLIIFWFGHDYLINNMESFWNCTS